MLKKGKAIVLGIVRQETANELVKQEYLQLIETVIVYKLPNMSREEIEAMFGLSELKQTRVYQEALQEGIEEGERRANLKAVPRLLELGLSLERIAEALGLKLEEVRQAAQNQPTE